MLPCLFVRLMSLCLVGIISVPCIAQQNFGHFTGDVVAKFLPDGRMMKIEKPFGFIDHRGQHWDVPVGAETDGASIPQVLWTSYPPFTGKYRTAAVIHDYMCGTKQTGWKETHEIFYFAMRAAGVGEPVAKAMYGAVYYYGPRWGIGTASRGPGAGLPKERQDEVFEKMREWIARDNPNIKEIAQRADSGGPFERR